MGRWTTLLHKAAERCDLQAMTYLVKDGQSINKVGYNFMAAIHFVCACREDFTEESSNCLAFLIHSGADINEPDIDGMTPLMFAAGRLHPHNIRMLLEAGAEITNQNEDAETAFTIACVAYEHRFIKGKIDDRSTAAIILLLRRGGIWTEETSGFASLRVSILLFCDMIFS